MWNEGRTARPRHSISRRALRTCAGAPLSRAISRFRRGAVTRGRRLSRRLGTAARQECSLLVVLNLTCGSFTPSVPQGASGAGMKPSKATSGPRSTFNIYIVRKPCRGERTADLERDQMPPLLDSALFTAAKPAFSSRVQAHVCPRLDRTENR